MKLTSVGTIFLLLFQTSGPSGQGSEYQGNILFQDDFSTYSRRWRVEETAKTLVEYRDEALSLSVFAPGVSVWSVPDFEMDTTTYEIEVTADFRNGNDDSSFGLVLNYADDDQFYIFALTPNGTWRFEQRDGAEWIDLTPLDTEPIEMAAFPVSLHATVIDYRYTFWVDEQYAGEIQLQDSPKSNQFGVITLTQKGYSDVTFDDMLVTTIKDITED